MTVVTNSGEHEESTTAEVAADALDPLVGQTIDGRFRIVDVIGKGAMGKVYRAVQLPLNRAVAIKLLDSRYGAGRDESFKQRFLVEAALTSKLNHPNTVRVLDYGSTKDGLFFLAMEYLDGATLEKVLSQTGALPWHRVLKIGQQMARALREAHELGVVHRDLKPGNVVLLHADDDSDFVKVLDFGLVKSFVEGHELEGRAITQQGMLMGSPPYMAPEQGEKNRADPRSDIYSLGTMLFEMLSGAPPFSGGGLEVILKHVNEPVPALVAPSKFEVVPEALAAIVLKCLAKSPMDRFQSMEELLVALQDMAPSRTSAPDLPQTEAAVPTTPAPQPTTNVEPMPRGPPWVMLAGFFAAVVAGVLGTWAIIKPSPPTTLVFHIATVPEGASVLLDGTVLGVTPLDLEQGFGPGNRATLELRLEKPGFVPASFKLVGGGGRLDVEQTLWPLPAEPLKVDEPRKPEPVKPIEPVKAPEPKKPEPVKTEALEPVGAPEVSTAPDKKPKAPVHKVEPKKKPTPTGPRPASKLDDDEEGGSVRNELKRPTAQP